MRTCYPIKTYTYSSFICPFSWLLLITGSYQNAVYVSLGTQAAFIKGVKSLITTVKEMGNPFWDTTGDLLVLNIRGTVVDSVSKMKKLGDDQRKEYLQGVLKETQSTKQSQRTSYISSVDILLNENHMHNNSCCP